MGPAPTAAWLPGEETMIMTEDSTIGAAANPSGQLRVRPALGEGLDQPKKAYQRPGPPCLPLMFRTARGGGDRRTGRIRIARRAQEDSGQLSPRRGVNGN